MRRALLVAVLLMVHLTAFAKATAVGRSVPRRPKADTTADTQTPQAPPVFRAGTDVVEVDVVVHDKNGQFVGDLSVDDFELSDEGRRQQVDQFYLHVTNAGGWSDRLPGPAGTTTAAPAQSSGRRVFVVVFDDGHLSAAGFKRTQTAALSLFTTQFRDGDVGGVVTNGKVVNNRLTGDRAEILKAVKDAKANTKVVSRVFEEREWPRLNQTEALRLATYNDQDVLREAVRRACSDDPDRCRVVDPADEIRSKAMRLSTDARIDSQATLQVLQNVLNGLRGLDGRKTVLLLSEGFIADETWPLVKEDVGLAARTNARIYTLDARGLDRNANAIFDVSPGGDDAGARMLEQMDFGGDSINSLAVDTGGFVVRNTNAFDKAIARIVDDASNYYVLGYRPSVEQDGKFHKIAVKVKRPGVAARARRGYVAIPRPPAVTTVAAASGPAGQEGRAGQGGRGGQVGETPSATASPSAVTPQPEPEAIETTVIKHPETASGQRVRPLADAHTKTLAGSSSFGSDDPNAAKGWEAYQRGDVEAARASLLPAAARTDAQAWVHYALGLSDYALRRYPESIAAWEKVRAAAPDFEPVYFDLVDGYLQVKEHDQAIRLLRTAAQRWPKDQEIFNALGVVQTIRGSYDDAIKSFQEAVTVAPQEPTSYFNLGKAFELRYNRSRHYVQAMRAWVANESDRTAAIERYKKYLEFGGAYADAAREGLTRLKWIP